MGVQGAVEDGVAPHEVDNSRWAHQQGAEQGVEEKNGEHIVAHKRFFFRYVVQSEKY